MLTGHSTSLQPESYLAAEVQSRRWSHGHTKYWRGLTLRQILTKLALLLFTGESWARQEATTLFFGSMLAQLYQRNVTKAHQYRSSSRTKMPPSARWCTLSSRSSPDPLTM